MLHFHCSVKEPKLGLVYLTSLLVESWHPSSSFLCSSDWIWPREEAGVVGIISPTSLIFQNLGSEGRGWRQVRLEWWRWIHCRYRRQQLQRRRRLPRPRRSGRSIRSSFAHSDYNVSALSFVQKTVLRQLMIESQTSCHGMSTCGRLTNSMSGVESDTFVETLSISPHRYQRPAW